MNNFLNQDRSSNRSHERVIALPQGMTENHNTV